MAEDGHAASPLSLTLMAGPIDCRISPTEVNKLATTKPISWFEQNLIGIVPTRYPGALRQVYPGFLQLMAFMNMNMERHVNSFREFYDDVLRGDTEKANAKRKFYEEYFAVADLPAEFYLEGQPGVPGIRPAAGQTDVARPYHRSARNQAHCVTDSRG